VTNTLKAARDSGIQVGLPRNPQIGYSKLVAVNHLNCLFVGVQTNHLHPEVVCYHEQEWDIDRE